MGKTVEQLEKEIESLHKKCEGKGLNSRGVTNVDGKPFQCPVNSEHKATVFFPILWSFKRPHMHTFWAATFGFFCTFFSCFAPGAIGSYIGRPAPEGLGLTKDQKSTAGNMAVTGTILMRLVSGPMCDTIGARKTFICLLMLGVPGMILMMFAQNYTAFLLARIMIGLSLATFVTCQVWCSQFFDRSVVGAANATAGGWGNVGGGFTLLLMPQIMKSLLRQTDDIDLSWRLCFIVPLVLHLVAALFIWTAQDLPDGSYKKLETSGAKQKSKGAGNVAAIGFSNTNAWIMLITYGFCFGVELTMNNKLVAYFERYYAIPNEVAGPLGATFSLMNLFARSWGGILSDILAKKYGMRGRICGMWVVQTMEGFMCIMLGLVTLSLDSPDEPWFKGAPKVNSTWSIGDGIAYTLGDDMPMANGGTKDLRVKPCASALLRSPTYAWVGDEWTRFPLEPNTLFTVKDPNPDCIHNNDTLGATIACIILFSIFVQMAEGLHFGIVPYISRPALGVVSGMVGAGGNTGALIAGQYIIGAKQLDDGFIKLGWIIILTGLLMHCIYFPEEGGILTKPGMGYDPQWIKPAANQKGSDELNFGGATKTISGQKPGDTPSSDSPHSQDQVSV